MQIALADGPDAAPARHRRLWTVTVWCLAFVVPVWLWTTPASAGQEPESAALVRAYLEAIRAGDVDGALDLAGVHPGDEGGSFLNSASLDRDWVVNSVVSKENDDVYTDTSVEAVITTGDGVSATGEFQLVREGLDDEWRFEEPPLVEVGFVRSPLWYVEVNGVVAPYVPKPGTVSGSFDLPTFTLLPGAYRFYSDVPGLLDFPDTAVPLLPGAKLVPDGRNPGLVDPSPLPMVPEATERVQAAVNALADECAAQGLKSVAGCPFGARYLLDPDDADEYFFEYRDLAWEITKYPVIAAVPGAGSVELTFREAGNARLTAIGLGDDGDVEVTMNCPIEPRRLEIGILSGGELRIVSPWVRFAEDVDRDPTLWETC